MNKIVPITFARNFDGNIRRVQIDDVWFFSILDMFTHYGQSKNSRTDWKRVQDKLDNQGFAVVANLLQHQFSRSDGQLNKATPCVNFNTLLRIAQVTNFKEWEYLRQYMADITEETILDPSAKNKALREKSKQKRIFFTTAIDETLESIFPRKKLGKHIAGLTNITYGELFGAWKQELARRYNLTDSQAKNFRDQFGQITLSTVAYIEEVSGFEMYGLNRELSTEQQEEIVKQIANDMADIFQRQCKRMNIDLLRNQPLLPDAAV